MPQIYTFQMIFPNYSSKKKQKMMSLPKLYLNYYNNVTQIGVG